MTDDEKKEAVAVAEGLGPVQICETLEDLVARERSLLDHPMDEEMRAITLHNIAVLTAACAGYAEAAENHRKMAAQAAARYEEAKKSAESEKARDDGESGGVDQDP